MCIQIMYAVLFVSNQLRDTVQYFDEMKISGYVGPINLAKSA
jgi:glutaredoxin-related protein